MTIKTKKRVVEENNGQLNWYEFTQNNSGGSFITDDKVCRNILIQAKSDKEACNIAEELGVYFDGCNSGRDCSCCGDRWSKPYNTVKLPIKYNNINTFITIEQYSQYNANEYGWTWPDARLYYIDGTIEEIYPDEGSRGYRVAKETKAFKKDKNKG